MCGYEKDAKHALGKRFFYKWTKGYGQNIVYYAQKCTVCQQKLEGKVYYWDGYWFDWWSDTEKFLNKLIEEGYVDESWMVSTGWKFGLWGVQTSYKVADFLWKALSVIQGTQGVYDPGHVVIVSTPVLSASDSDTPFEKQDHPIMDKIDLTSARITADYDKLLKPGGDVECVAAWKDSAGAIEAAKAKKKETPDSNGAKGGAVFEVQEKGGADQDGGGSTPAEEKEYELGDDWENAEEPVRMLKDSAAIDGLTPMDDYEFDLTRTGAQPANASGHVEYATFPINPDFYKSLDAGPYTITVWVEGVDRDTGEPVSYTIDKEIQIVELDGEKLATEPLYKNGYATMSVSPESGACTGQSHTPAVTLKTPAETLVEGKDYELCYFRVVDGKTMIPVKEIRAAGEYLIAAIPHKDSGCHGMASNVYRVTRPELAVPGFILPAGTTTVEEAAFQGGASISAVDARHCAAIGANAFADCTGLKQIRLPKFCDIDANAFGGSSGFVICAPAGIDESAGSVEISEGVRVPNGSLADGTAEKWAADNNIPFVPLEE